MPDRYAQDAIRPEGWTRTQLGVVALFCTIAFIAYVQRLCISVTDLPVRKEFGLDIRHGTWLLSAFAWGYAFGQIPCGWLTDYWGTRKTLALAAFVWSAALGLLALANGFAVSWLLWFSVGVVQSCVFSCATRGLRSWLPVSGWARANGALTGAMYMGGGVTTALTAILLESITWRAVYALYSLIGIAWAIQYWFLFRDEPGRKPSEPIDEPSTRESLPAIKPPPTLGQILRTPAVWALMAQQIFRTSPYVFFASLFPMFLQQHRGLNLRDSGVLGSVPLFATLLGCIVSGFFADGIVLRYANPLAGRRAVAVTGLSLAALSILTAMWVENAVYATLIMGIGTFGSAFSGVAAFTAAMDVGRQRVGMVFGMMNTAGNVGSAISPIVVGEIITRYNNWNIVVAICAGLYVLATICWVILGATNPAPTFADAVTTQAREAPAELKAIPLESTHARS